MQPAGTPDDAAIRALGASQLGVPVDEVTAVAVRRFRAALQAACAAPTDEAVEVLRQAAAPVRDRVRAGHLSAQPELTDAPGEDHPPSA